MSWLLHVTLLHKLHCVTHLTYVRDTVDQLQLDVINYILLHTFV